jgi:hypothetical protein
VGKKQRGKLFMNEVYILMRDLIKHSHLIKRNALIKFNIDINYYVPESANNFLLVAAFVYVNKNKRKL